VILCDVGVYLNALIERAPHHEVCRMAVEQMRANPSEAAVSELVLAAVVRIGTNPKVFRPTPTAQEVFEFVAAVRTPVGTTPVTPGPRHWQIFQDLVLGGGISGADTTDAYLAALAIESRCEWWTTDRGFGRFPGLRWRNLVS